MITPFIVGTWIYALILSRQILAVYKCLFTKNGSIQDAAFWSLWVLVTMAVMMIWRLV